MNLNLTRITTGSPLQATPDVQVTSSEKDPSVQTLTITGTISGVNAGGPNAISFKLEYPVVGPEDLSMNEVEQACQDLGLSKFELNQVLGALFQINHAAKEIAANVQKMGPDFVAEHKTDIAALFQGLEVQFGKVESSFFEMVTSSKYPDFSDFLKLMLKTAQDLRQIASEAKAAAIGGQYDLMMDQAANMITIADKNYAAGMKEVEAAKTEAIFKIVGGCLSFLGAMGGFSAAGQLATQAGSALGQIFEAAGSVHTSGMKTEALALRKEGEYLEAGNKRLDATAKLIQEQEEVAQELKDIAKTLQDMVLKLYQDFVSSQSQIIQRSNV